MTAFWTEAVPRFEAEATCRGYAAGLRRTGERWEDENGIVVCVKARLDDISQGCQPDYVFHEPMPSGLRGAPAP